MALGVLPSTSLAKRLHDTSRGRLKIVSVEGRGRCLELGTAALAGEVLAEESPLVSGSSGGEHLAVVCCDGDVDASEDLLAACIRLELRRERAEAGERLLAAGELDRCEAAEASDPLLPSLSEQVLSELPDAPELLARWRGVCATNAETWIERSGSSIRLLFGLFGALSMAEHSCMPNAKSRWQRETGTMQLVAVRDISAGERISRSYLDAFALLQPTEARREQLQSDWGFLCDCPRCSRAEAEPALDFDPEPIAVQRAVSEGLDLAAPDVRDACRAATAACKSLGLPTIGWLQALADASEDPACVSLSFEGCGQGEALDGTAEAEEPEEDTGKVSTLEPPDKRQRSS